MCVEGVSVLYTFVLFQATSSTEARVLVKKNYRVMPPGVLGISSHKAFLDFGKSL